MTRKNEIQFHALKKVEIVLEWLARNDEIAAQANREGAAVLAVYGFDLSPGELTAVDDILKGTRSSPYVTVPPGSNIDKLGGLRAKWAELSRGAREEK